MKPILTLLALLPVTLSAVDWQPFAAHTRRVLEAMDFQGSPLPSSELKQIKQWLDSSSGKVEEVEKILDRYCLVQVDINGEMRVKVQPGEARPELVEDGWRLFLIKVHNAAGTTAPLKVVSPNAGKLFNSPATEISNRWLDLQTYDAQPLKPALSGLELEYRIVQLYSRDAGKREAKISCNVGQGTQDIGFRNEADILFTCLPAHPVTLRITDDKKRSTTASLVIRDAQGRVYPSPAKRLAPDFAFHPQVYRADGDVMRLPSGEFSFEVMRGPESVREKRTVTISPAVKELAFAVERWIDPSATGWWSGDHHIHAAGCAHYTNPTEGVHAPDMLRHCLGEDLKVGCNLTWGPCFDYQKQFFTGQDDKVSIYPYLLHYDVEVSQFGSHQSGHLCLLRLKEQIYPGGDSKNHWPTLGLNTLRWAKKQGAVCGPAHSGWGLQVKSDQLPNYIVPPFDGIGANEYIVDVTHQVPGPDGKPVPAVDFLSTVDTPYVWELNMWYHTLNAGFRTRISGETDFPCIYGEKVGLGRSYVRQDQQLNYNDWCQGIREGRNYVGDGKSHLMDFKADGVEMGINGSELRLGSAKTVHVSAKTAARLEARPDPALRNRPYEQKPYWDIERARLPDSRKVEVELIVNGESVARKALVADGHLEEMQFDVAIKKSSWIALRILPSSHTNPIFIVVDGKPVLPSRRSVEWCLKGVDQCWTQKERFISASEKQEALAAYEHARQTYRQLLAQTNSE